MSNEPEDRPADQPEEQRRPAPPQPGEPPKEHPAKLAGFEIIESIGQGGMGSVYKARQVSMDRLVALKILSRRLAGSKAYVQRFVREARAAAKLNHVNIVQGIDVGKAAGHYYFVMELIDGETVHEKLRREGPLDEQEAVLICLQVAKALHHAHERATIIHRDVKPQNILIDQDGVAKLADLGLARHTEQPGDPSLTAAGSPLDTPETAGSLTAVGTTLGTPDYISPEQVRGETDLDGRCDVYSLGATLYHLLVGRPPYAAGSANVVMAKHLTERVPDVRAERPGVSPNTTAIVRKAMQKDKRDRYQSAEAMAAALEAVCRRGSDSAAAVTAPRAAMPAGAVRASRPGRQSSQVALWLAAAALIVAAVGALVLMPKDKDEPVVRPPVVPRTKPPPKPPDKPPDKPPPKTAKPGKTAYESAARLVRENKSGPRAIVPTLRDLLDRCRGTEYEGRVRAFLSRAMQQLETEEDAELNKLKARARPRLLRKEYAEAVRVYDDRPPALASPRAQKLFEQAREQIWSEVDRAYDAQHAAARAAAAAGDFGKAFAVMKAVAAWGLPDVKGRAEDAIADLKAVQAERERRAKNAEFEAMSAYVGRIVAFLKKRDYVRAAQTAGEAGHDGKLGSTKTLFTQLQADIGLCDSLWADAGRRLLDLKPGTGVRLRGIKRSLTSFDRGVITAAGLPPTLLRDLLSIDLFELLDADYRAAGADPLPHFKRGLFYTFDRERNLEKAQVFFKRAAAGDKALAARGRSYISLIARTEPEQAALMLLAEARAAARKLDWPAVTAKLGDLEKSAGTRTYQNNAGERTALALLAAGRGLGPDALFSGQVTFKDADTVTVAYDFNRKSHRRDWLGGSPAAGGLRFTRELRWNGGVQVRSVKFRLRFPGKVEQSELRLMCDKRGDGAAAAVLFGLYRGSVSYFRGAGRQLQRAKIKPATPFVLAVNATNKRATLTIDGTQAARRDLDDPFPKRGSIVLIRSRTARNPAPLDVTRAVVTGRLDLDWARARLALLAGIARSKPVGTARVPADKEWTDTGLTLAGGKYYLLRADGRWQHSRLPSGGGGPMGLSTPHRGLPLCSLVGRTDEDVFFVGDELVIGPNAGGRLFLGMNDVGRNFSDNSGALTVEVRELPGPFPLRYEPGLIAAGYAGTNFDRFALRSLTRSFPLRDRELKGLTGLSDRLSVRWTGYVKIAAADAYEFGFAADDGFRMWVDGKLILDHWKSGNPNRGASEPRTLTKGYHRVRIEFFEARGAARIALHWRRRGQKSRPIPPGVLFHSVVEH